MESPYDTVYQEMEQEYDLTKDTIWHPFMDKLSRVFCQYLGENGRIKRGSTVVYFVMETRSLSR